MLSKSTREKKVAKRGRPKKKKRIITPADDYESKLVKRIEECQLVINEIDASPLWQIVLKDMEVQRKMLDDNWQEIADPLKLEKARELKFATMHILLLKDKYTEEKEETIKELKASQETDKSIIKDYDLETKMEK